MENSETQERLRVAEENISSMTSQLASVSAELEESQEQRKVLEIDIEALQRSLEEMQER